MTSQPDKGVFFFHNPKAGGTSINRALGAMYPTGAHAPLIENTERDHEQRAGQYGAFRGYRYYGGHYGRDIFNQVAESHDAVTNFRHPAMRLASLYEYFRTRVVMPQDDASRDALYPVSMAQTHDFHDFVAMNDPRVEIHTRNYHVRQLSASPWDPYSQGDLDIARTLVDGMIWYYVCEQREASQHWADAVFRGRCPAIGWENRTADAAHSARVPASPDGETARIIEEKNALDLALYRHAADRLRARKGF